MTDVGSRVPFRVAVAAAERRAPVAFAELPAQMHLTDAAELLGCPLSAVEKYLGLSPVEKLRAGTQTPQTISAEGVHDLADRLAPRPAVDTSGLSFRQRLALARPPADGDTWLTTTAAAEVLGVTQRTVRKRAEEGTIPFAEHESRRWYRRTDVEVLRAARQFSVGARRAAHGA